MCHVSTTSSQKLKGSCDLASMYSHLSFTVIICKLEIITRFFAEKNYTPIFSLLKASTRSLLTQQIKPIDLCRSITKDLIVLVLNSFHTVPSLYGRFSVK